MLIPNVLSGLEKGSAKPLCVGSIPTRASNSLLEVFCDYCCTVSVTDAMLPAMFESP